MADIAVRLTQAGEPHLVPLIRATMDRALRFVIVAPGKRVPLRMLQDKPGRPLAVILSGDGKAAVGPDAFPQARRLLRWTRGIMVHATGGKLEHYAEAARATVLTRRLVVVETDTAHEAAWLALAASTAPGTPMLRITAPPGAAPHPNHAVPAGVRVQ